MITGKSRLICTLGDPVSHSISPLMHNEGFEILNLDYAFLCFKTGIADVDATIAALKRLNARGFSCTMPVKVRVAELADELSPAAELMQAVNTAVIEDGKVIGYNTDGTGYVTAVKKAGYDFTGKKITLLGGGGAATAIAVQLALDGAAEISIFNRRGKSYDRSENIANKLNAQTQCHINIYDFEDKRRLKSQLAESYILANSTPVGMAPDIGNSPISDVSMFHDGLIVTDTIYNPRETKLISDAKLHGCQAFGGLNMLLYQGVDAFKIWTGEDMPIEAIKNKFFNLDIPVCCPQV